MINKCFAATWCEHLLPHMVWSSLDGVESSHTGFSFVWLLHLHFPFCVGILGKSVLYKWFLSNPEGVNSRAYKKSFSRCCGFQCERVSVRVVLPCSLRIDTAVWVHTCRTGTVFWGQRMGKENFALRICHKIDRSCILCFKDSIEKVMCWKDRIDQLVQLIRWCGFGCMYMNDDLFCDLECLEERKQVRRISYLFSNNVSS